MERKNKWFWFCSAFNKRFHSACFPGLLHRYNYKWAWKKYTMPVAQSVRSVSLNHKHRQCLWVKVTHKHCHLFPVKVCASSSLERLSDWYFGLMYAVSIKEMTVPADLITNRELWGVCYKQSKWPYYCLRATTREVTKYECTHWRTQLRHRYCVLMIIIVIYYLINLKGFHKVLNILNT